MDDDRVDLHYVIYRLGGHSFIDQAKGHVCFASG